MAGLVLELQAACIDSSRSITDVLRMASMIAIKLNVPEAKEWLDRELNGYGEKDGGLLPPYRITRGQVKALNPHHGLVPALFENPEVENLINDVYIPDSVERLLELMKGEGELSYRFEPHIEAHLIQQQGYAAMRPYKVIGTSHVAGVINSIRNRVLDWALELETNGIIGENMSFNNDEKAKAADVHVNNIIQGNVQGTVGQTGGTANQTFNNQTIEAGNFESLANHLRGHDVLDEDIIELQQAVTADGALEDPTKFGPRVSAWIGKMTTKAADGSWGVTIGAAGNVLGGAITTYLGG